MQIEKTPWLFLVDRSGGRLLQITHTFQGRPHIDEKATIENTWEEHQHGRPSPLAAKDGHTNAGYAHEQETILHRFGKDITIWLKKQVDHHKIDRVHMFAATRLLGELRKTMNGKLNGHVIEHESELMPLRNDELLKHPSVQKIVGNVSRA